MDSLFDILPEGLNLLARSHVEECNKGASARQSKPVQSKRDDPTSCPDKQADIVGNRSHLQYSFISVTWRDDERGRLRDAPEGGRPIKNGDACADRWEIYSAPNTN